MRKASQRPTRRGSGGPTIHDVAREASVSAMTVSRVVNGERNVREATRAKVMETIAALGYSPNAAARNLAGAKGARIGLLYSNPSAAYLSEFLLGGLDQCSRAGLQLIVEKAEEGAPEPAIDHLIGIGVDGVLLPPPLCDAKAVVDRLKAAGIPVVAVAAGQPMESVLAIRIDDFEAARDMTRHLIGLGHRRIGFVSGHPNQTASARRREGYLAALADAGVKSEPGLIVQGYFTYHSGLEAAEQLLSLPQRPSAVFASNDDMAAAAVAAAHRRGLDVPRDLTVAGFDDTALATTIWPPLTTIRQPVAEMAREAVILLAEAIRRREAGEAEAPEQALIPHALVTRQSEGPPA